MLITYVDRYYIDHYRCIDKVATLQALSYIRQGDLYYFEIDRFNYKVIEKHYVKEISEVQNDTVMCIGISYSCIVGFDEIK